MERICQQRTGLFPSPDEIKLSCSCPDWADMCKHVAAVLYGIGARLDQQPELLFRLHKVDEKELIAKAGKALPLRKTGRRQQGPRRAKTFPLFLDWKWRRTPSPMGSRWTVCHPSQSVRRQRAPRTRRRQPRSRRKSLRIRSSPGPSQPAQAGGARRAQPSGRGSLKPCGQGGRHGRRTPRLVPAPRIRPSSRPRRSQPKAVSPQPGANAYRNWQKHAGQR